MKIRFFQESDAELLLHLFYNTIRIVNSGDYSQRQVEAWAPEISEFDSVKWKKSFENKFVFISEKNGEITGFGELEPNGHIDRFYIHHQFVGQGVGNQLYKSLENKARELNLDRLFVEASITAKLFFMKMGFSVVKEQTVYRNGVDLNNFVMEKFLS